ncbi:SspB family protein [Cohaesibacter celericrescens]|uniref:Stringent starvation protein B n=1 Tax=Cohaesibacter celericrescens TaxID=2067669 RepID=A0A2N5XWX7_9HYPH|nr:ClpXP protease specificity-enhancing factor SspB [Cohaesibacter celericrescens]PLW75528.1 hypothetical protein C0081_19510 [Cohaesibacter celericrescens]PLW78935.1 hypothetical protein C0081_01470 [Cohaesibacter celericrescens]
MSEDLIRYDILAQDALRGVVKTVLTEVSRTGLPGEHHFYITFNTHGTGVRISPRLLAKYPEDMTIVLQHQFWDMTAHEQAIEIGLSFDGIPEKLYIPYSAIITFIDPSVHFSLQFEVETDVEDELESLDLETDEGSEAIITVMAPTSERDEGTTAESAEEAQTASDTSTSKEEDDKSDGAEVVSLDAFRKK